MQKLFLCGNLTADPVLNDREYTNKETGEIINTKVCHFTVAVDVNYGSRKRTDYFRVTSWRGLAESCAKYLKKGSGVTVLGTVSLNNFVDKNNNLHAAMEVTAEQIQFLTGGKAKDAVEVESPEPVVAEEDSDETPY